MTPLFPDDNQKITIKQGQTGDCYLLAVLDCVLSSGKEGRDLVASMFTQNADESVTLRIPHNRHSQYLFLNNINAKYQYVHNKNTNTDEITISKAQLERIDENRTETSPGRFKRGVSSNSLAVKILEHISSYYFATAWNQQHSVVAHDQEDRYKGNEAAVFVSKLLGIEGRYTNNYDDIIRLKMLNPEQPLYIEMDHGEPDRDGRIHGYHALRVKRIEKTGTSYNFVLANPWDNSKEETYSLNDIQSRNFQFCELNLDKPREELNQAIIKCPQDVGKYIYSTPTLFNLLLAMQKNGWGHLYTGDALKSCVAVHKSIPYFQSLLHSLTTDEQQTMLRRMLASQGSKEEFIKQLLSRFPRINLLQKLLEQETNHEHMGEILVTVALTADEDTRRLLSSQEAFNVVVNTAIKHKAQQVHNQEQPYEPKDAQWLVEEGLLNHFFKINDSYLVTRNAGLRALCSANIFTRTHIQSWLKPESLLAKAITEVINSQIMLPEVKKYIESNPRISINEGFLDKILAQVWTKDPHQLFEGLKKLNTLDTWLAKRLFPLLAAKVDHVEPGAFKRLAQKIATEPSSIFKAWFIQLQTELLPHTVTITQQQLEKINRDTQEDINKYTLVIDDAPTPSFENYQRISEIDVEQNNQIHQLNSKIRSQELAYDAFFLPIEVKNALEAKVREVRHAAMLAKQKVLVRQEGNVFLAQINFAAQLDIIGDMTLALEEKAISDNNYLRAAVAARALHNQLLTAKENLLTSNLPKNKSILEFKNTCIDAIDKANLVLEEHRGWKEVLEILASAIISIATLLTANLVAGRWRLFSTPTHSAAITNEVKDVFKEIPVSACGA